MAEKSKYENLTSKEKSSWLKIKEEELKQVENSSKEYIDFLNACKTERECVQYFYENSKKNNFIDLEEFIKGDSTKNKKIVKINKNKSMAMAVIGTKPITEGISIICAHIDSPRLDLKQNPLFEDGSMAFLKTHYYGGIKKYHWLNIPLAIHGKITTLSGKQIDVKIGEDDSDPVFIIPDLLPHLSKNIIQKKVTDAFPAENLNLVLGHIPIDDKEKEAVKINILNALNQKYGVVESDFNSAELEIVPALKAREAGLDRSFVAGYGQDDRMSSFCAFQAIMELKNPERTSIALFIDKEEIGSEGNSSIQSKFFEIFLGDIIEKINKNYNEKMLKMALYNAFGISSDVDVAYDPNYKEVFDIRNVSKIGNGIVLVKYTGHGGKYGANDANSEYVGKIRKIFTENEVFFQFGSLGKVDEGGGGTISKFLANYGMEIIDAGPPVLGMHSPYELSSKIDLYQCIKAYQVFYNKI